MKGKFRSYARERIQKESDPMNSNDLRGTMQKKQTCSEFFLSHSFYFSL